MRQVLPSPSPRTRACTRLHTPLPSPRTALSPLRPPAASGDARGVQGQRPGARELLLLHHRFRDTALENCRWRGNWGSTSAWVFPPPPTPQASGKHSLSREKERRWGWGGRGRGLRLVLLQPRPSWGRPAASAPQELAALLVLGDRMRSAGRVNSQARGSEQGSCWTRNKDWGEGRSRTSDVC